MEKHLNTVIVGSGCYLPERVITNDYFLDAEFYDIDGKKIERTNEDIIEKFRDLVGVTERRYARDGVNNSDMAAAAAEKAIEDWGGDREDLDYVIVAHNYASHFGRLKNLILGDIVIFTDMDGNEFRYKVAYIETLAGTAIEEMQSGEWDLTLFTCTPGGKSRVTIRCVADD